MFKHLCDQFHPFFEVPLVGNIFDYRFITCQDSILTCNLPDVLGDQGLRPTPVVDT